MRFTIGRLMIVVAGAALVFFAGIEWRRLHGLAGVYRSRAAMHAAEEKSARASAAQFHARALAHDQGVANSEGGPRPNDFEVQQALTSLDFYVEGARKYNSSETEATAEKRIKKEIERVRRDLEGTAKTLHAWAQTSLRRAEYRAALKRKYERAGRYPWITVEPDGPEPD